MVKGAFSDGGMRAPRKAPQAMARLSALFPMHDHKMKVVDWLRHEDRCDEEELHIDVKKKCKKLIAEKG